jgi:hypothetical protein
VAATRARQQYRNHQQANDSEKRKRGSSLPGRGAAATNHFPLSGLGYRPEFNVFFFP